MENTKEKILTTALHLFAQDGYEAVSVSRIAGELGITKGALYKHYKNKQDIFDSIVERMYQIDAERSQEYEVPEETCDAAPETYENVSMEHIREFTLAQFRFWTEDEFASDFRKLLTLEQYRNAEMAELYKSCITAGPLAYMEDIFRGMAGIFRESDPKQLALTFFAPLFLLITISDHTANREEMAKMLDRHIENFIRQNRIEKEGE